MNIIDAPFQSLTRDSQVDFFVRCQSLLLKHHVNSPFVCRVNNMAARLNHMQHFVNNYHGFCYADDHVCVLFNHMLITDPHAPEQSFRQALYKPPAVPYNTITVDWVVFDQLVNCGELIKRQYNTNVQYVLFVRHNKIKLYKALDFLKDVGRLKEEIH
jgi:hypothetical protein